MFRLALLAILAALIAPSACAGQGDLEAVVKRLVGEPTYTTGFDVHELWRSGDAATITALKILDPATVRNEKVVSRMIFLIETAFGNVDMIQAPQDRNPGVSLLFLEVAASQEYSPEVKRDIALLRDSLIQVRRRVAESRVR
jgi:hypothetical protein